jgi:transposase InsO family protein
MLTSSTGPLPWFFSFQLAKVGITEAINAYNCLRPHAICDYLTPAQAHSKVGILSKRWSMNSTKRRVRAKANPF